MRCFNLLPDFLSIFLQYRNVHCQYLIEIQSNWTCFTPKNSFTFIRVFFSSFSIFYICDLKTKVNWRTLKRYTININRNIAQLILQIACFDIAKCIHSKHYLYTYIPSLVYACLSHVLLWKHVRRTLSGITLAFANLILYHTKLKYIWGKHLTLYRVMITNRIIENYYTDVVLMPMCNLFNFNLDDWEMVKC